MEKVEIEAYYRNGQLHRDGSKPARIKYDRDGKIIEEEYYKFGVMVTKEFAASDITKMDPQKIIKEVNVQRRMMLINLYGLDKLLTKLKYKIIEISKDDQYELLEFDKVFPIKMMVLKMRCPSSRTYYFIPVSPDCTTIKSALDYYYGGNKFDFVSET